jgi:hypothetical protein
MNFFDRLLHFLDLFPAKIQMKNKRDAFFEYENMNISIVDIHFDDKGVEWLVIKDEENSNTIIEINLRVLQRELNESNHYRIVETIFSNFNLFPQVNLTHIGMPISYQIANMTTIKTAEDLIRFQILVSKVGSFLSK